MKIENKFPGKDVSHEDMETKFPLVAKKMIHIEVDLQFQVLSLVEI